MAAENKDRITCHVLDTAAGVPAKGLRITLSGPISTHSIPPSSSSAAGAGTSTDPAIYSTTTAAAAAAAADSGADPQSPHLAATLGNPTPLPVPQVHTFESTTDSDGRVKVWLPYSSATSSGDIPVYTLEDVLGLATSAPAADGSLHEGAEGGPSTPQTWRLRFDTAGYFGGADKTFFPEVNVTFTVMPGQSYHVPLLLSPYSYTTYRGS